MKSSRKLLFGKTLLIAFLGTVIITILSVYLSGITSHRSILENSVISLSILALCFFLFLAVGLYSGLNVLDNYSHKLKMVWRKALKKDYGSNWIPDVGSIEPPDLGDGIGGIILGILLWILVTIVLVWLLISLQAIVWLTMIISVVGIYWVLIRALKLIFSKSSECEGDLVKSITYAFGYTVLYIGWIYGVVYATTLF